MLTKFRNFVFLSGFVLFAWACNNDDQQPAPAPVVPTDTTFLPATPLKIEAPSYFGNQNIPENNPTTVQGVELGRMLFYEKMLSTDNTISCGSCHKQELAFTDGLAVSPGVNNATGTRSSMSLANAGWFRHFMWDGAANTLEEQARLPILNHLEMNSSMSEIISKLKNSSLYPDKFGKAFGTSEINEERIVKALAQFQRTLVSANSKFDRYLTHTQNLSAEEMRGFILFRTHPVSTSLPPIVGANCGDCHGSTGILTLDQFKNNGLDAAPTDRGRGAI
ncbi:MAG: cytochrome-c peroxidase, partial [Moraxellaceae bacterium]